MVGAADGFWSALALLAYTYAGYPLYLVLRRAVGPKAVEHPVASEAPSVSVILALRNERRRAPDRIRDLLAQHYPDGHLEVCVVSDGSTDGTDDVVQAIATTDRRVRLLRGTGEGKAAAINMATRAARGDILVFADARQRFERTAIRRLVAAFADARVGAVSGRLELARDGSGRDVGIAIYRRLESWVREQEAKTGSTVGVTGAIYAARRAVYPAIPTGTVLDDVYAPMYIALRGWRIAYEPTAVAYDPLTTGWPAEFRRKVRTLVGNYQLLALMPHAMVPVRNPLLFRFVSHKLLRLTSPFLLAALFGFSWQLSDSPYRTAFAVQLAFYVLAAFGLRWGRRLRVPIVQVAATFVVLNAAALVAFLEWLRGRPATWAAAPE